MTYSKSMGFRTTLAWVVVLALLVLTTVTCLDDGFLYGKACDDQGRCRQGYVCHPETGTCVRPGDLSDAGQDAGDLDGGDVEPECGKDSDCDDDNACTDDACQQGTCLNAPNQEACDDGDDCTDFDHCLDGECRGVPICPEQCAEECTDECPPEGCCIQECNDCPPCPPGCACSQECDGQEHCDMSCQPDSICTAYVSSIDKAGMTCLQAICDLSCNSADRCDGQCEGEGALCQMVCNSADRCTLDCMDGASCEMDCNSTDRCELDCQAGTRCLIHCDSVNTCDLTCANPVECGDGIRVCNRPCPD